MATDSALSTLSRYEALFELSSAINTATEIAEVGQMLASRLKYVADVFSWRYFSLDHSDAGTPRTKATAMVIDGFRGKATVDHIPAEQLSEIELDLWRAKKSRYLEGNDLNSVKSALPAQFQREDLVQIYVCPRFGPEGLEGMLLYGKRRQPFNELDIRFVTLSSEIFHAKVHLLWEQKKLRDLETAYLHQEIMLRQSEKLATLGRLSAGMAHELNNPVSAALRGAEQLQAEVDRLAQAHRRVGDARLSGEQGRQLDASITDIGNRVKHPPDLDPIALADVEADIEQWLEAHQIEDGWRHATTLAAAGLEPDDLAGLAGTFANDQLQGVVESISSTYSSRALLEQIGEGAKRISEIVKALKSYTYLDQAKIQSVDVHEGLNDTLVMLRNRLGDVTVRRDFDAKVSRIEAFGSELNQVWTNIIDNAVAAMDGRGVLTVATAVEEPWVIVTICDTGHGIAASCQSKVFDPFFTTKPPGQGTGLGLNISHSIITQKHQGSIEVRSAPGDTCFTVRLPLHLDAEAAENELPASGQQPAAARRTKHG